MSRILALAAWVIAVMATAGPAHAQGGFLDTLGDEPQKTPAPVPMPAPSPAPGPAPQPDPVAAAVFPALVGCDQGLSGLPPGTKEETIAYLNRRLSFWLAQTLATIEPFKHPAQAEYVDGCLSRRVMLLGGYLSPNDQRKTARALAAAISKKWGGQLDGFLSGDSAEATKQGNYDWWRNADQAFDDIAGLEVTLERAARTPDPERDALFAKARSLLAEFEQTIETAHNVQDTLDDQGRAFWLRALAWRARGAGLAIDVLQRWDLEQDPEEAYAYLLRGNDEGPPTAEGSLAGELAPFLARLRQLREARGTLDPGAPRDWSAMGQRKTLLEELYLVNYMAHTIEDRIDDWQREERERKRLDLRLRYDVAVRTGTPAAQARTSLDAVWKVFREKQSVLKDNAIEIWRRSFAIARVAATQQGVGLGPGPIR